MNWQSTLRCSVCVTVDVWYYSCKELPYSHPFLNPSRKFGSCVMLVKEPHDVTQNIVMVVIIANTSNRDIFFIVIFFSSLLF